MLIPGEKCRHFIPGKKFQGKNVDIFSPRIENSIPRNGEILFLEKRARHHLNGKKSKFESEGRRTRNSLLHRYHGLLYSLH